MSIIGMLSGTWSARKVATSASQLWQDSANFLILSGCDVKWQDTSQLLRMAYSLAVFTYVSKNIGRSPDFLGAVVVQTARFMGDILEGVWSRQLSMEGVKPLVAGIVDALPEAYHKWESAVCQSCRSAGLDPPVPPSLLIEKGVAFYLDEITVWHQNRYHAALAVADKAELHRAVVRNLGRI